MSDEANRTSAGRPFQSRGPAVANDRSLTVVVDYSFKGVSRRGVPESGLLRKAMVPEGSLLS